MIFHKPDRSFKRLSSCHKRAVRFAKKGEIDKSHGLFVLWVNCKMFLDANEYDLHTLDYFSMKLDEWAVNNILEGDETISEILRQWLEYMPCDPTKIRL